MLNRTLLWLVRSLLFLRYSVRVRGFSELTAEDGRPLLFLPNHPALIDPIIVLSVILRRFKVSPVADRRQIDRPLVRWLARRLDTTTLEDAAHDRSARGQIQARLAELGRSLESGTSILLYPSGHITRTGIEELGGNSAVSTLLTACPTTRVVLVRTRGLWGSSFSRASGRAPDLRRSVLRGALGLLTSFVFFAPRRRVTLEFVEPTDLPPPEQRTQLNRTLEEFFNRDPERPTYIPYSLFERGGERLLPEPEQLAPGEATLAVSTATRQLVFQHLTTLTGQDKLEDGLRLGMDLGLDSLARLELASWVEREFGFAQADGDALFTVADVLLAASGVGSRHHRIEVASVPDAWFEERSRVRLTLPETSTILHGFLESALRRPSSPACADETSKVVSYRQLLLGATLLARRLETVPGRYIGVMLPASVAATMVTFAVMLAGRVPVMLNFTTGPRGVEHALRLLSIECVVSAERLMQRLSEEGFGSRSPLTDKLLLLEHFRGQLRLRDKLVGLLRTRLLPRSLGKRSIDPTAVVLFTSGSENIPKAVPLTHANILTNLRAVLTEVTLTQNDTLLSILPPFHSFGITVDLILPLLTGLRVVFHNNPTESGKLALLIERYRPTLLVGTPTFLGGIAGAARHGQLQSLRLCVTGAEQCPEHVFSALSEKCPGARIIEGYGITECSPVVSLNRPGHEVRGSIGHVLPNLEWVIVDPETLREVRVGERGLLLVRGPSVFTGYLGETADDPFVIHAGRSYYRTGDLVRVDPDGNLIFVGRMKRFIKLGGEMISLPAIEETLRRLVSTEPEQGPVLAVAHTATEPPELVLFSTLPLERPWLNQKLRDAGFSPLHNLRRVVVVEQIPVLGTGKTDYRALASCLSEAPNPS